MRRRAVLKRVGVAALGAPTFARAATARVVVVGGGYGGATAARALRVGSQGSLEVTLVEPEAAFVSGPLSNQVLAGNRPLADITRSYDRLVAQHGVRRVRDRVVAIDPPARRATLASGSTLAYDKLLLAPGVELMVDQVEGLDAARRQGRVLQAWTAGDEIARLRRKLEALPDGGVFAIAIPEAPYRCPPAPYERACLVADWFARTRPRSKVLVLDANDEPTAQKTLFQRAWAERYPGRVEYRPQHRTTGVEAATNTLRFEFQDDLRADLLNVLPPMRAGRVAVDSGLATVNGRWCGVEFVDFRSSVTEHVHIVGDAIQGAALMPKSGEMARTQALVAAAAIVAALTGRTPDPAPEVRSACYSFVDATRAGHLASVHRYDPAARTYSTVPGLASVATVADEADGRSAWAWAQTTWDGMFG